MSNQLATRNDAPATIAGHQIDYAAVLRTMRLDPAKPETQALMLICDRYGLDPVLRHVVLIEGRPYVTRDGLLHVAHKSDDLDGIVVEDMSETPAEWTAKVSVYRRSMTRPFTYPGRYSKQASNKKYGPEMALKVAEVMALRRAFDVAVATLEERDAQPDEPTTPVSTTATAGDPVPADKVQELVAALDTLEAAGVAIPDPPGRTQILEWGRTVPEACDQWLSWAHNELQGIPDDGGES